MAWLGSWKYRITITVDNTNIDSDLSHFPVPIAINSSAGQGNDDLTTVFDEIGSNSLKLAVTKSDGETQLYVEIEKWDSVGEDALLWASSSGLTLTSASTTTLYLYFDNSQADNSTYVGTLGNRTEVWDSNFKAVYHMADASGGLTDSTSNNKDCSVTGSPSYRQAADIGYSIQFIGGNDYFYNVSVFNYSGQVDWTNHLVGKFTDEGKDQYFFVTNANTGLYMRVDDGSPDKVLYKIDDGTDDDFGTGTINPCDGDFHTLHQILDDSEADHRGYEDGVLAYNGANTDVGGLADTIYIGTRETGGSGAYGYISEVRISSSRRANAWMKAEHYGFKDNLLEFGNPIQFIQIPLGTLTATGYAPTVTAADHYRVYAELSSGVWTNISDYIVTNITGYWGMLDEKPTTLMADTGEMKFILDNQSSQFVPGVTGALTGWDKGTPIKIVFQKDTISYIRFYGKVVDLDPDAGLFGGDMVSVVVADWLDYAATHPLLAPAIVSNKRSDEMMTTIVADMPIAPQATDYETGVTTFDTAFDTLREKTRAYSEISKVTLSEFAPAYLQKDPVYGETLVLENEHTRNGLRTADFTLDNSMKDIELVYGENVINYIKPEAYPREVAGSSSVLFETKKRILVPGHGEVDGIRGNYTDPEGGAEAVGANMIAPVTTTDYTMYANRDGTGTNLTANLTVTTAYGASGVTYKFENTGTQPGWVWIRARGYLVERYHTVSRIIEDEDSRDEYGYQPVSFKQKYQQDIQRGSLKAESIIEYHKTPRLLPKSVTFVANRSSDLMDAWLQGDVGKVVRVKKDDYDIDVLAYIQGINFSISKGGVITVKWILQVFFTLALGLSLINTEFDGSYASGSEDGLDFGYLPELQADEVTERSISFWVMRTGVMGGIIIGEYSNYNGMEIGLGNDGGGFYVYVLNHRFSTTAGQWKSPDDTIGFNTLHHIVITYEHDNVANDPAIWIDNVSQVVTEVTTPVGTLGTMEGNHFVIGCSVANGNWPFPLDGDVQDVRVWPRIITNTEIATVYGGGDVEDDLVFQGPCVRTAELSYYDNTVLASSDRVLDCVFGRVGKPHGVSVTTQLIP